MINKFARLVAPGAASLVMITGCSAEATAERQIDLHALPEQLPAAVGQAATRAVKISVNYGPDPTHSEKGNSLSGFRISSDEVLTASHGIHDETGAVLPNVNICGRITISGLGIEPLFNQGNKHEESSYITYPNKFAGNGKQGQTALDATLLTSYPGVMSDIETVEIRDTPVEPGEALFFLTYQPTAKDLIARDPMLLGEPKTNVPAALAYPAVYGGIALGEIDGHILEVATKLKSYGKSFEDYPVPGASGGAVLDMQARLVGELIKIENKNSYAKDMAKIRDLKLPKNQEKIQVRNAIVQVTPPSIVNNLRQRLQDAHACASLE